MKQRLALNLIALMVGLATTNRSAAEETVTATSRAVQRVPAGVVVSPSDSSRWNRVVMLAKPRIASGDTDSLPGFLQQTVSKFVLTILATVDERPEYGGSSAIPTESTVAGSPSLDSDASSSQTRQHRYRLVEVGVGHSVQVGHKLVVVTPEDYEQHGVRLSFLERQFLGQNQRQFSDIRTVVRTSTLLMFDVPALILRSGEHQEFTMRHLVWVDSESGALSTLIWLLQNQQVEDQGQSGGVPAKMQVVATEPICWWDSNQMEDRAIHVDQGEFTLGIPGKRAFALEAMPAGRAIPWKETARVLGGLSGYAKEDLVALMLALRTSNQESILEPSTRGKP